jgi:hypothetical protein
LFFLQPISRGWARYRGQLVSTSKSSEPAQSLDSLSLSGGRDSLEYVNYWAEHGVDRIAFVSGVVEALNRQGWPNKPDVGWSDYDVRVFGNRWTHLQLTTVTEDYSKGAQMLRCRLQTAWTLRARVALWLALAVELLVSSLIGRWWPCFAAAALTVLLSVWFVAHQQRKLQSLMVLLLNQVAKRWNLAKSGLSEP